MTTTEDTYRTVGLKIISALYWFSKVNSKSSLEWIVKVDDDVLVNVDCLDRYLSNQHIDASAIHCRMNGNTSPMRNEYTKWYVSKKEYLQDEYPPFCVGTTYIMSLTVATYLVDLFKASFKENYLWIEDVYITGILRQLGGMSYVDMFPLIIGGDPGNELNFISAHLNSMTPRERRNKWRQLFSQ